MPDLVRLDVPIMNPLADGPKPAVLGHRGSSAHARENTLEAYRLAADQGAAGVELDVRRTADGEMIIHHDAAVPGAEPLVELTLAEVRDRFPWIPTFAEAMEACRGMLVNVEVKNAPRDPDHDPKDLVAAAVAAGLAADGRFGDTVVSSFNPETTARLRALDDRLRTGQLLYGIDPMAAIAPIAAAGHQAIHPYLGDIEDAAALVAAAAAAGLWIVVWTVNEPADLVALAEAGVDAVIVDDPAAANTALGR